MPKRLDQLPSSSLADELIRRAAEQGGNQSSEYESLVAEARAFASAFGRFATQANIKPDSSAWGDSPYKNGVNHYWILRGYDSRNIRFGGKQYDGRGPAPVDVRYDIVVDGNGGLTTVVERYGRKLIYPTKAEADVFSVNELRASPRLCSSTLREIVQEIETLTTRVASGQTYSRW